MDFKVGQQFIRKEEPSCTRVLIAVRLLSADVRYLYNDGRKPTLTTWLIEEMEYFVCSGSWVLTHTPDPRETMREGL